jgi:hypothetical protein
MATTRFTRTITIAVAALVASLALTALAVAGQGERKHIQDPYFVVTSGGAYVDYNLAATPAKQRVLIDGTVAKVKLVDAENRLYVATVSKPGLKQGHSYRVRITVRTRGEGTKLLDQRMFRHKRHKVEPQS